MSIFALTRHCLFDYYQSSDFVQRQTKTKAGERKHYYTWSVVGRKVPRSSLPRFHLSCYRGGIQPTLPMAVP